METVRIPAKLVTDRLDARYNARAAVEARETIESCSLLTSKVGLLFENLVCGPFGSTLTADEHSNDGEVLLIQPTNISSDLFSLESSWRITEKTRREKDLPLYPTGSFLFARVGIYPHVGVLPEWVGPATIGSSTIAGLPNGKVDPYYLLSFFRGKYGQPLLFAAQKVTAQPTIGTYEIATTVVPVPEQTVQTYIGDKVRQAEQLRERSRELEKYFQLAIEDEYPEIFGAIQENGNHSWATLEDLSGSLNPGAYNPERLRVRRYLKGHSGKQIQNIATIETPASSIYHPNDIYIGLDAISSNSSMITSSTVKDSEVEGNSRILLEGPVISKLRPYLNKVTYIPPELAGALGSTELLCVQPKNSISGWFLYGVLKLESTNRQLNPASTGSTHPRISREDVLDLIVPWHEDSFSLGEKLRIAQEGYFAAEQLTTAAKLLVEALIEGKVTELELQEAQEALQRGDNTLDRHILSRLTRKGIPARGEKTEEPPLFPDLDALYRVLSEDDDTDEDSDWDSTPESRQRWQTSIQRSRRAAEASISYSPDATVTLLDEEGD
ncbi:hypothetical protein H6G00_22230 [Leptolyngbya sp. FACHB-541]|uniref:restriction endonuclease subunit S n=1 Tax=Leptolyngbya sp. FACHB-541 TaxID=2692810 RepID=UPI001687BA86|nr:hypothetical protein [Leptolyngbya sp. FACHB-541]MBD1999295.1 hypothetical protein [Leptolyngbya sp. FACHB-541]